MPSLDATAKAALNSGFAEARYIYLDISGDPLRVTNFGADTVFSGTGDSDLDGFTFTAFGGKFLEVGDVGNSDSGSEALTVTLSGIVSMDTSLVNAIGDKALWQGRTCRIWGRIYDETGVTPQGAVFTVYTGYMSSVSIIAAPEGQTIRLSVENYLSFSTQASNRSYLNQKDYDSADNSAAATLAAANGLRRGSGAGAGTGSGGGFDGARFGERMVAH